MKALPLLALLLVIQSATKGLEKNIAFHWFLNIFQNDTKKYSPNLLLQLLQVILDDLEVALNEHQLLKVWGA